MVSHIEMSFSPTCTPCLRGWGQGHIWWPRSLLVRGGFCLVLAGHRGWRGLLPQLGCDPARIAAWGVWEQDLGVLSSGPPGLQ